MPNIFYHIPILRLAAFFLVCIAACAPAPTPKPTPEFVDVGSASGLNFSHDNGASGDYFLFETMGAGAAFLDYDLDGHLDLYLLDGFDLRHLKGQFEPINLMRRAERFSWVEEDFTPPLRYDDRIHPTVQRVSPADDSTSKRNRLFRNRGDGTFHTAPPATGSRRDSPPTLARRSTTDSRHSRLRRSMDFPR